MVLTKEDKFESMVIISEEVVISLERGARPCTTACLAPAPTRKSIV